VCFIFCFYFFLNLEYNKMSEPEPEPVGTSYDNNTPVEVNLTVGINASGDIALFGQEAVTVENVIVADVTLPANALYNPAFQVDGVGPVVGTNSMFEFWEPAENRGARAATLSGKDYDPEAEVDPSGGRNYKFMTRKLVGDIQNVLNGAFDVSKASPFNAEKYDGITQYDTVTNFGELALRTFSHYLLGHIDATSAITNDQEFVHAMMSQNSSGVYLHTSVVNGTGEYLPTEETGSNADANLARLLVQAIVSKDNAGVLAIAEQVLGQDVSRAMDQDNNIAAPDVRQALKFIPGDIIYMNISLTQPTVTVGTGQNVDATTIQEKYVATENYTLKITLS
jgi:hypothetical protein